MCLLTICVSSLEKCLFKFIAHFKKIIYLFIYFYLFVPALAAGGLLSCSRQAS